MGIKALAQRQLDFVVPACRAYFKNQIGKAIDLGAGLGIQMSALRAEGIISSATCIDTPFVSPLGKEQSPEHTWIGGDLRNLNTDAIPTADLLWVGNLLHHYDLNANFGILNRFASKLSPNGIIVIQDYVVGSPGLLGLAAAALGVHFALTTNEGRNYSEKSISALCEEVFPEHKLDSRADGQFSSLLFYRKS
ncbi:MAG: class I SAM-dependent methyltransferase [Verrucomicrobiales bacterium]|nr:class I SAM-dependent methyltransferase [Verrucomicrobiales bacterium]